MSIFIKKKNKKQSLFNHIMFHLHLWFGLLSAIVVFVLCFTGACVVFKDQIIELSNYSKVFRSSPAENECSIDQLISDYKATFGEEPSKIVIPESKKKNLVVYTSGHNPAINYYDRETGQQLGEVSGALNSFFAFIMQGHRRLFLNNAGGFMISWGNVLFLVLLISGIVLWFPKSKSQIKARFRILFPGNFATANYRIHVNWGFYSTIGLLVISFTGLCFSFHNVQEATTSLFKSEQKQADIPTLNISKEMDKLYFENLADTLQNSAGILSYDSMLQQTNNTYSYNGQVQINIANIRKPAINFAKRNTHNFLGAELTDNMFFDFSGKPVGHLSFGDLKPDQKLSLLMMPLHTGKILGFKTQIFYFLLCLVGAWFPISGFILWWNRVH